MTAQLIYHALTDPESLQRRTAGLNHQLSAHRLAYAYYTGTMFATDADWSAYLTRLGLYKHTRLVFNPVPNVIDFYVDNIWRLAENKSYPQLITPALPGTDNKILKAVEQLDQWCNWWQAQEQIKQYTASTGACLVEIIDDVEREKITQQTIWRGYIKDKELNSAGDVQSYTIEYDVYDAELTAWYKFKKSVNKEVFRYYKDDKPFNYPGKSAVMENEYGFVPAAYFKHSSSDNGAFTDFSKVNHANSLGSHLHDNIHKEIESGKIIFSDDPSSVEILSGGTKAKDGTVRENDPRLERVILAMKGNGSIGDLSGLVKLAEAHPYLKDLLLSFADDYPELEYRQIIKSNGQLSGRALERLLTPAQNRLDRAAPNYDGQLIKLRQMQIAIAGYAYPNWRNKTRQQNVFKPFGLKSYEAGNLDFGLKRSILIEPNEEETIDLQAKKLANAKAMKEITSTADYVELLDFLGEDKRNLIIEAFSAQKESQKVFGQTDQLPMNEPKQLNQ